MISCVWEPAGRRRWPPHRRVERRGQDEEGWGWGGVWVSICCRDDTALLRLATDGLREPTTSAPSGTQGMPSDQTMPASGRAIYQQPQCKWQCSARSGSLLHVNHSLQHIACQHKTVTMEKQALHFLCQWHWSESKKVNGFFSLCVVCFFYIPLTANT